MHREAVVPVLLLLTPTQGNFGMARFRQYRRILDIIIHVKIHDSNLKRITLIGEVLVTRSHDVDACLLFTSRMTFAFPMLHEPRETEIENADAAKLALHRAPRSYH